MKKRIVALVLALVMTVLSLASCSGAFDFVKEDLGSYATFDYAAFKDKLAKLEIKDGSFTTNEQTRQNKVIETIYDELAAAIIEAAYDSDKLEEGVIGERDVLYFVYYAVDEATGNVYFTSEMKESAITATSTKDKHVIELGSIDVEDENADEFKKLIKENLADTDIAEYVYSMLTADDIKSQAEADLKASEEYAEKDPTTAQISAAQDKALTVKAGDTIVISYTRSYPKTEGETTLTVTESAVYETITLDENNPFHKVFLYDSSVAKVGDTLKVEDEITEDGTTYKSEFKVKVDEVEYTYSAVKIEWKVENAGKAVATFKYTPYAETSNSVTPDNLRGKTDGKVDLKGVELTYYVFPVYRLAVPAADEVDATVILSTILGADIAEDSLEVFEGNYVYKAEGEDDVKIADLVAEIVAIYAADKNDDKFYKEGTDLAALLNDYNNAKTIGGSKPTASQQALIDETLEALTLAQRAEAAKRIEKIVAAVDGDKVAGDEIVAEYKKDTYHTLKEAYDTYIVEAVQAEIWELIESSVTVTAYPEKLVEEYSKHIYDSYEYDFYKGDYNSTTTNYKQYEGDLNAFLIKTLDVDTVEEIDAAIEKQAKEYLEPIIKIYVVAKAANADAVAAMSGENGYIELDIKAGLYDTIDEESYRESYGDEADKKIEEAKEDALEDIEQARRDADKFLIDKAYMKAYKKEIGGTSYNQLIETYGEINLRASFQFNRLFYYLTSYNMEIGDDSGHLHAEAVYTERDGVDYIDFRTVTYSLIEGEVEEIEPDEDDDHAGHDH